jgi:hypothetical protein
MTQARVAFWRDYYIYLKPLPSDPAQWGYSIGTLPGRPGPSTSPGTPQGLAGPFPSEESALDAAQRALAGR